MTTEEALEFINGYPFDKKNGHDNYTKTILTHDIKNNGVSFWVMWRPADIVLQFQLHMEGLAESTTELIKSNIEIAKLKNESLGHEIKLNEITDQACKFLKCSTNMFASLRLYLILFRHIKAEYERSLGFE